MALPEAVGGNVTKTRMSDMLLLLTFCPPNSMVGKAVFVVGLHNILSLLYLFLCPGM